AIALIAAKVSVLSPATQVEVYGSALLLIVLAVPSAAVYVLAVVVPVSQTVLGAKFVTEKAFMVLVAVSVIGAACGGRIFRPKAKPTALAVALVCYLLLSALFVSGTQENAQSWRYALMSTAPLLCLPLIAGADVHTRRAVVLFSFTTACLSLIEAFTSHASLHAASDLSAADSAAVAAGQTGAVNHNAEGALFVLALSVLLAHSSHTRNGIAKLAHVSAIAAVAIGVAYSFSRASYFGAIAVMAVFALRRSVRGLLGATLGIGCLVPFLPSAVLARFGTVWSSTGLDASSAVRFDLWASALRMFSSHPFFGVGYLDFAQQLPAFYADTGNYEQSLVQFSSLDFAHSTYLTVLAETGLVGAVLVTALIVGGWRRARLCARAGEWVGEAAMLAVVGVGVCSAFGEVLLLPAVLAGFLLVVLAGGRPTEAHSHERSGPEAVAHA
ncbi:MAG TPA: O-antigen ligase family protein, partial [Streptosporangiaceae bacterium]